MCLQVNIRQFRLCNFAKNKLTIFRLCNCLVSKPNLSIFLFTCTSPEGSCFTETNCQQQMFLHMRFFSRWMLIFHDIYKHVQLNPAITFRLLGSCSNRLYKFKIWIGEVWRWKHVIFSSSNVLYEQVLIIYNYNKQSDPHTNNSTIYWSYILDMFNVRLFFANFKICLELKDLNISKL